MLAAVAQLTSGTCVLENLRVATRIVERAAAAGAQVRVLSPTDGQAVFLPEATDFIAPATQAAALTRSPECAQFVTGMRAAARKHSVWISVGIHEPSDDPERAFNTHLLIDAAGDIRSSYRKLHLFDVDLQGGPTILESRTTVPGSRIEPPTESPIGRIGLLTCYDMRFAEPALALRARGAQVLTYPSAFAVRTGGAHWETLLRARAIETQSWVLAAAQVGAHPGSTRVSWGHALIVDPWGSVVAQCSDTPPFAATFCLANIDLDAVATVRAEMPLWDQRRTDVYAEL
ncbi:beta-ureidopropionase [Malassezia cuniculi]|uniref:Beta-ureidopropionase n=1 Tax=Malassezia cuniculi TaxID=948313 RepID=A0AAF0J4U7_9BASI|nr:beta-ureidopropionase [Malassezia cuniculi]